MALLQLLFKKKERFKRADHTSKGDLRFMSVVAMEQDLDGSEERFANYYFAVYHCSPDGPASINKYREQLKNAFPTLAVEVGTRFVLTGEAAFMALSSYYKALIDYEEMNEEFKTYAIEFLERLTSLHRKSQCLPVPIALTEGQLSTDRRLEFLTSTALSNGQVVYKTR